MVRTGCVFVVIWVGAFTLDSFFPGLTGALCVLALLLAAAVWLPVLAFLAGLSAWRRQWRRASLRLTVLLATPACLLSGSEAGDYVHLALMYPFYRAAIGSDAGGPVIFDWGDSAILILDGFKARQLVYDPTSATAALVGREKVDPTGLGGYPLITTTQHLVGPFYLQRLSND